MKSPFGRKICAIAFLLFFIHSASLASDYPISTYLGIDQGLSNNSVRCIYQDHSGFMWFGTYDGLNRYDGYQFKIFRNNFKNNHSLPNNWINAINEDTKGNLWIGTRQGACIYQNLSNSFAPLYYYTANKKVEKVVSVIRDIETDQQGNMFVATADRGLLFFPKGDTIAYKISLADAANVPYDVMAVTSTKDGTVWILAANGGLYAYDHKTRTLRLINAALQAANCLESTDGYLWVGSNEGVSRFNLSSNSFDKIYNKANKKLSYNSVVGITKDKNHELWIATNGGGVVILNTKTDQTQLLSNTTDPNSLSSNAVYSIWIDPQSRKWIGTLRGGINVIDPNKGRFQTIASNPATPNTLINNYVLSFYEAPNNNLWIGTDGGGLSIWNRKLNQFTNYQHEAGNPYSLSDNFVTDIKSDFQNNIWVSTYRGGVDRFHNGKFEHYACVDPNHPTLTLHPLGPNLLEDAEQNFWLSSQQYGLFKLNRQKKVFELFDHWLRDMYTLKEDRNHVFWAGGLSHLIRIDKAGKKHVAYFIGKPVRAIWEDRSRNFWIGMEGGGLILFDRKQGKIISRYTTNEGLCSNSVLNILEDPEGNLWMSTFNGIAKFNPKDKTFNNYYQSDGLQSNQFNYNAAWKLRSGEFVFGGIKGFTLFKPEHIKAINSNPKVFITDVRVANIPVEEDPSLETKTAANRIELVRVPYNKAVLSFEFAALEYSSPTKIQYAYYLQGWDRGWNYPGATRKVVYTHLSEGTYIFRVKSTNAEGQWNKDEVQIKIMILPPWYRSWWAYSIYFLMAAFTLYIFQRYKAHQTKLKYEMKLARIVAEKERAERETERVINEKKLSFFTNISHEFRTPLTLIINPVKDLLQKAAATKLQDANDLKSAYRNARRMLSLVDQLLLFQKADSGLDQLKPARLNFYNLCQEVYLCFVQEARSKNITNEFDCSNDVVEIYGDREKLEIILYNLISNALKYTPEGGKVVFKIRETEANVEVSVADNGSGIPGNVGDKLFDKFYQAEGNGRSSKPGFGIGLYLVKHFTEQHKGSISYQSEEGGGTTFTLKLQKGKAHLEGLRVVEEGAVEPVFLKEMVEDAALSQSTGDEAEVDDNQLNTLVTEKPSILIVDDEKEIRHYITQIFKTNFTVYEAESGEEGVKLARKYYPDIIITDIKMQGISGIELCKNIKQDPDLNHIPVILLTGTSSTELKLEGVEGGADDYITKPFEKELLIARVANLLKSRDNLQKYFFNEITLNNNNLKVSAQYKDFLEKCIVIVESHLDDDHFTIKTLSKEIGMSHSSLYNKVKLISGLSLNGFIRFIRLRKAAELFINSSYNVNEVALQVGFNDIRYFRKHFNQVFGMAPSEYIKKYRKPFENQYNLNRGAFNKEKE